MTPKEEYVEALINLLKAQQKVQADEANPFNLDMPVNTGLTESTFITHADLEHLKGELTSAASNNAKFAKLWGVGRTLTNVVKTFI